MRRSAFRSYVPPDAEAVLSERTRGAESRGCSMRIFSAYTRVGVAPRTLRSPLYVSLRTAGDVVPLGGPRASRLSTVHVDVTGAAGRGYGADDVPFKALSLGRPSKKASSPTWTAKTPSSGSGISRLCGPVLCSRSKAAADIVCPCAPACWGLDTPDACKGLGACRTVADAATGGGCPGEATGSANDGDGPSSFARRDPSGPGPWGNACGGHSPRAPG